MAARRLPVLEIGGTHVTAAVVDTATWQVVAGTIARRHMDAGGPANEIVAALVDTAASLRPADVSLWGVAVPGPFAYARGIGDFRRVGKFDALSGVDLGSVLRHSIAGGAGRVEFVNDAVAFAVGEWVAGAAFGHHRVIGVTLGTGVGSAFLVRGVAQSDGPGVPAEGRLDLLEIAGRPLEDTVSRRAVRTGYAALTGEAGGRLDVRDIAIRARAGDRDAARVIEEAMRALGGVLAPRAVAFGATVVVVGGSMALAWDLMKPALRAGMADGSPSWASAFDLRPARAVEDAPLVGAAWHALRRVALSTVAP